MYAQHMHNSQHAQLTQALRNNSNDATLRPHPPQPIRETLHSLSVAMRLELDSSPRFGTMMRLELDSFSHFRLSLELDARITCLSPAIALFNVSHFDTIVFLLYKHQTEM